MSVTPRGMSVQEAYREFRDGSFRVNRQYQRKLVWTLEEKRKLIDSILHGYPIPLILLATRSLPSGTKQFEILDGMQRLNALFSFIENRFGLEEKYFDVQQLSRAKQLAEQGAFRAEMSPDRLLSAGNCADFLDYTLAVTEFPAVDERAVNDVFGRINAYGRHLSRQEQRQAGLVSPFAKAVRELAAEIRGDVSAETLDLAEMPQISISVEGEQLDYGIRADDTFWCNQGILRRNQLRESEDEQMLADLAISILDDGPFAFSGDNLDKVYDPNNDAYEELNTKLDSYGVDALKHDIQVTISILRDVVEKYDDSANALRRIVNPTAGGNPIKTHFYSVFMAFYELCVTEQKTPAMPKEIMKALENLHNRLEIARGQVRSDSRRKNIDITKGLIQKYFEDKVPPAIKAGPGLGIQFENTIRRSTIESAAFECKQGLLRLDDKRSLDPLILDKLTKTICAIANIGPRSSGAIFLGVADSESDRLRIEELDDIRPREVGKRFVVGVDRELKYLGCNLEHYKRRIVQHISASGLSEPLRTSVTSAIDCVTYRGLQVICIWVQPQNQASHVDDVLYVRVGSETQRVHGFERTQAVIALFR
jgi:hypothetical protein